MNRNSWAWLLLLASLTVPGVSKADQCVTQSQMLPSDRDSLSNAALALAQKIQANDATAIRAQTMPRYAQDFSGMASTIATTSPQLANATFQPETLWILDASPSATPGATPAGSPADNAPHDAQFFCNLNRSRAETSFAIAALPPGRYGLAIVDAVHGNTPWQISMLLRQSGPGTWQLAGLFPRPTTAAGHDGLWYWKEARAEATKKENWSAWIDYTEADQLLKPVNFVGSSHLDQLHEEQTRAAPPGLSSGIGPDTPLVIKAKDGTEYQVIGLGPDSSLGGDRIDVAMHFRADPLPDPAAARARNLKAAAALVAAYPELRARFHGVWSYAESNGVPFASEEPMSRLQ